MVFVAFVTVLELGVGSWELVQSPQMPLPRVRFAPSPTGYLHIGGARTALFNWLFARRHGGTFILRIEDTDAERSSDEMVEGILEGLRWLGLDWDEGPGVDGPRGPYFQSQRLDRHLLAVDRLLADGHAYFCFCTGERLQAERAAAEARGEGWQYDRHCLNLSADAINALTAAKTPRAVRLRVPDGSTRFDDLVHGSITVDHANIEDFVIVRSDGLPTYQLSVVCDDIDMAITHVVRGDDHISNTPKQILLYEALRAQTPQFAHVPLILGPDKKRLSKRHGATSVTEYRRDGYLPEAMVNFLALLGWSPGTDEELFTRDELVARFDLQGISGGNAVLNPEKLEWFNAQHLARLPVDELIARARPELVSAGLWNDDLATSRKAWFEQLLALLVPRAKRLGDFAPQAAPFLSDVTTYDEAAIARHLSQPEIDERIEELAAVWEELSTFDMTTTERSLRELAARHGMKAGALIHATRIAVTGRAVSPGLFETITLMGRDTTVARLRSLAGFLRTPRPV
jgi:glutamyl-tRNA synthetase